MTCIVNAAKWRSKKAIKEHISAGGDIVIHDPSIIKTRDFMASEINEGENVIVTNHPARTYFAEIGRKKGKLYVK